MLHYRNIYLQLAVFVLVPGFPRKILIPAIALAEVHIFRIELLRFFRRHKPAAAITRNQPVLHLFVTLFAIKEKHASLFCGSLLNYLNEFSKSERLSRS